VEVVEVRAVEVKVVEVAKITPVGVRVVEA